MKNKLVVVITISFLVLTVISLNAAPKKLLGNESSFIKTVKALHHYALNHDGFYPDTLTKLAPFYLPKPPSNYNYIFSKNKEEIWLEKQDKEKNVIFTYSSTSGMITDQNKYKLAKETFNKKIGHLKPAYSSANTRKAVVYYRLGLLNEHNYNLRNALKMFKKAAELDPQEDDYLSQVGLTYYRLGKQKEAYATFAKLVALDPSIADKYYQTLLTKDRKTDTTRALLEQGFISLNTKKYNQAATYFQKVHKKEPNNPYAHIGMGHFYYHKEDFDNALNEYKTALLALPNNLEALKGLGKTYYIQGKYQPALEIFKKLVAQEEMPEKLDSYFYLVAIYQRQNNVPMVTKQFQLILKLDPKNQKAYSRLSNYYYQKENFVQMENFSRLAIKNYPDDPYYYYLLGIALFWQEKYQEADHFLFKALEQKETTSWIKENITLYREALVNYAKLSKNPSDIKINRELAKFYVKISTNKAKKLFIKQIEKLIKLDDNFFMGYLFLTYFYQQNDETKKALTEYRKFVSHPIYKDLSERFKKDFPVMNKIDPGLSTFFYDYWFIYYNLKIKDVDVLFGHDIDLIYTTMRKNFHDEILKYGIDFPKALLALSKAKNKAQLNKAYMNLGLAYVLKGDLNKALDTFKEAKKISPNAPKKFIISVMYGVNKDYDQALTRLHELEKEKDLDKINPVSICLAISLCYHYKGEKDKAAEYINKGINLSQHWSTAKELRLFPARLLLEELQKK